MLLVDPRAELQRRIDGAVDSQAAAAIRRANGDAAGAAPRGGASRRRCRVRRRIRALEEAGIIRDYVALLDSRAVGRAVTVFIEIRLDLQVKDRLDILERAIREWPEVLECNLMTGDVDYMLRVAVPDVNAYEHFLRHKLTRLEGVASIKSSFALKQVKYTTALPIGA